MLALVRVQLATGMQHVITIGTNAMDMVDSAREATTRETTGLLFHELFEAIFIELLVLHVVVLVLLHVGLVLEGEIAPAPIAMEMRGLLGAKRAIRGGAILNPSESEETLSLNCIVLAMIIEMHLHVARRDVNFVARVRVYAMIMGLFLVVLTPGKLVGTIVHGGHPAKPILECLLHLLMPFGVANHFFLFSKHLRQMK